MPNVSANLYVQHRLFSALCPLAAAFPKPELYEVIFDSEVERMVFQIDEFESRAELMDTCSNESELSLWELWKNREITSRQLGEKLGVKRIHEICFFIDNRHLVYELSDCLVTPIESMTPSSRNQD
eukprot:Gregarina_sp_Poly_1__4406@NODE_2379_length_2206_cov_1344_712482_g1516_i0_p1_GENE_NODE_2379_length_2206_cov_1344_712482_g1516_i0NODE_2379_length_2206_cov_1344_712482_g1516_i0_p1_ORF_typecomplete_len126_score12_09_NODE_2379_length_2206_cov_1344_712482_g1516_i0165542